MRALFRRRRRLPSTHFHFSWVFNQVWIIASFCSKGVDILCVCAPADTSPQPSWVCECGWKDLISICGPRNHTPAHTTHTAKEPLSLRRQWNQIQRRSAEFSLYCGGISHFSTCCWNCELKNEYFISWGDCLWIHLCGLQSCA